MAGPSSKRRRSPKTRTGQSRPDSRSASGATRNRTRLQLGGSLEHRLSVKKRISQGDNSQLVRLAWHILGQDEVDRLRKALEEARR